MTRISLCAAALEIKQRLVFADDSLQGNVVAKMSYLNALLLDRWQQ